MRVLIADDEKEIAEALGEFIESCGHDVAKVTTGGLDVLKAHDRFRPNVVIMDIMMPHFNGITVSHALVSKNPHIKVVLFSGKLDASHPFVASSEATHFLPKPVPLSEIKKVLDEISHPSWPGA
jgi:CheY-like chemotaxis protein